MPNKLTSCLALLAAENRPVRTVDRGRQGFGTGGTLVGVARYFRDQGIGGPGGRAGQAGLDS